MAMKKTQWLKFKKEKANDAYETKMWFFCALPAKANRTTAQAGEERPAPAHGGRPVKGALGQW